MNGVIEWGDFTPKSNNSGNGDRLDFLWLKSGNTYRVRPVAKPVIFYKYFYRHPDGKLRTAICEDPVTCPVRSMHPEELKEIPGERFAMLVIDRADQKLKIMEFPKSVFLSIKAWWAATQTSPGGASGVDWSINITGSGKTGTKYTTTALVAAPFTEAEKAIILAVIKNDDGEDSKYLENMFKAHSAEVIEKRLFAEWEQKGGNNAAPAAPAQAAVAAPAAPVQAVVAAVTQATPDIEW